ncbi:STAS domain-containing protein [Dactylosporangium sp. CA-233914]|uniref:STAS domain-containing protein n=1 Tax=Dactylosporangium sp. CA-233914 TaxID=3239934 RepID=UPI003D908ED2
MYPSPHRPDGAARRPAGSQVVALSGVLDATERCAVWGALTAAIADGAPPGSGEIVVDVEAVQLVDAGLIRLLLRARRSALDAGRGLRVTGAHGVVRQAIEAAGAGPQLLPADPDRDAPDGRDPPGRPRPASMPPTGCGPPPGAAALTSTAPASSPGSSSGPSTTRSGPPAAGC